MSFQSLGFFAFLAVTAAVCLPLGRRSGMLGRLALGIACLVFYLGGISRPAEGLAVLLTGGAVTFAACRMMAAGRCRKAVFAAAVCWHIVVLLVFKYTGFFTGGAVRIGWAPVGLSFFTFQQIWLLKETYTGVFTADLRPVDFLLYTFFFPSVTSGPILRPAAFFPQLDGRIFRPDWTDAAAGAWAIAVGTVKKILLADSFGVIVGNGWNYAGPISAVTAWTVILGYTLQLYFDFSGYCDIAMGAARLLGIRLPVNFDSPYRSLSVTGFWKRWHMTLTTFLRECVYFPLGGSRKGALRAYGNIVLVFLISGFWHGAGWTFLVWGALHGLAQVAERALGGRTQRVPKVLRWALTFLFINLAWIFFRAPDLASAVSLLRTAFTGGVSLPASWLVSGLFAKETAAIRILLPAAEPYLNTAMMALLYGAGLLTVFFPRNTAAELEDFRPGTVRSVLVAVLAAWSVISFTGVATFIYANF